MSVCGGSVRETISTVNRSHSILENTLLNIGHSGLFFFLSKATGHRAFDTHPVTHFF